MTDPPYTPAPDENPYIAPLVTERPIEPPRRPKQLSLTMKLWVSFQALLFVSLGLVLILRSPDPFPPLWVNIFVFAVVVVASISVILRIREWRKR